MASVTILSDNGATSGSAGLKTSGGNDGVLLLQTTTSGGTPTTAISISNTQVVTYTNQPTYTGGTANGVLYLNGSKAVTSGTALVFDGTNLGLGVSPSAWGSGWSAFQVGGNGSLFAEKTAGASKLVALTQNAYHNGTNNIYISSDLASRYRQGSGAHIWETAASGTAGNSISFTQAMTLNSDANGVLLLGTTSTSGGGSGTSFIMGGSSNSNQITFQIAGSRKGYIYNSATETAVGYPSGGALNFQIDGVGTVGKFDSSGNLLTCGLTSLGFSPSSPVVAAKGFVGSAGLGGSLNTSAFNIYWTGSAQLWIDTTNIGNIQISSDYRIKKNIETQTASGIDRVLQLRPVTYELADYGDLFKADGIAREGFIAHEVQEVIPSGAEGQKDEQDRIQNLRVDAILAVAVKAIQEQQAIITQLQADVVALKGKA